MDGPDELLLARNVLRDFLLLQRVADLHASLDMRAAYVGMSACGVIWDGREGHELDLLKNFLQVVSEVVELRQLRE